MKLVRNPRFTSLLKWVSQFSVETQYKPPVSGTGFLFNCTQNLRSFATETAAGNKVINNEKRTRSGIRITPSIRKMAEEVMLDYFYSTRGLHHMLAESMSKNSPIFINNLLKKVGCVAASDINQSITRHLRFYPVNEFEPFLESSGLKPTECNNLVPCDKLFLSDDVLLLENHHVLCEFGIDPKKIGKIFKEAREVFGYETGVLSSKIQVYEGLGFSRLFLLKLIVCSPRILIGDMNVELANVLEMLKSMGFGIDWVMKNLSEEESYDWSSMHRVLSFLRDLCVDENELRELISTRPRLIFEDSGEWTLILAGFETKLGSSRSELSSLFQKFPQIQGIGRCVSNLRHCFLFLKNIDMEAYEIGKVFRSHSWWLGVSRLKQAITLLKNLKGGKSGLRQVIQENPEEMKKWTMESKIQPLLATKNEIRKMTQLAMFDYFYRTRGLQFLIAESMSNNAPVFYDNLLKMLKNGKSDADGDLVRSITRFLRFHPVNEYEPFLESLGLKPSEFGHLIPSDKMFLNEDAFLLENYHIFLNYGIGREKMGKIFKVAKEVFGYETGVLASKIQAYEDLGFSKLFLPKLFVGSPSLLTGNMNVEFDKVMAMLKSMGFGVDWVTENLPEEESYDWSSINRVLSFLRDLCVDENELRELISKRPRLIFENSGEWTLILAGFETKLGSSRSELSSLFQKLPQIQGLGKCVSNLRHCFLFLKDIDMEANEIRKVFCSHSWWLGVSRLKQSSTLQREFKGGKKRQCQVIQENPEEMKKWIVGLRVQRLAKTRIGRKSKEMKIQFLLDLGYKENSEEMQRALKSFCGRGSKLRERFNVLVSLGLNEKDVKDMVKADPNILTQECDMLESKVNYLVDELGYPISTLVASPTCLRYTLQRMKLRFEMFSWLQARGKIDPKLAVCTILKYSDKTFETKYVNRHPDGPKHFEDLKKKLLLCA